MNIIALLALAAGLAPPALLGVHQSFPLVCRGGGGLQFLYTPYSNASPDPQVRITFERGPQGVGADGEHLEDLQPGQCSWRDRPVDAKEPDRIVVPAVTGFSISWSGGSVTGIGSDLPYLSALLDENRYQTFMVYNDRRGNLIVTGVGG